MLIVSSGKASMTIKASVSRISEGSLEQQTIDMHKIRKVTFIFELGVATLQSN